MVMSLLVVNKNRIEIFARGNRLLVSNEPQIVWHSYKKIFVVLIKLLEVRALHWTDPKSNVKKWNRNVPTTTLPFGKKSHWHPFCILSPPFPSFLLYCCCCCCYCCCCCTVPLLWKFIYCFSLRSFEGGKQTMQLLYHDNAVSFFLFQLTWTSCLNKITVQWLKSNLFLKIECQETHIYMKTECFKWGRKCRVTLIQSLINARVGKRVWRGALL